MNEVVFGMLTILLTLLGAVVAGTVSSPTTYGGRLLTVMLAGGLVGGSLAILVRWGLLCSTG